MKLDRVLKDYPNAEPIKEGGQKAAYRIDHPKYGPTVLKIGSYTGRDSLERIRREVDTLRTIESNYYPNNYEFKVEEDEQTFVILEEWIESTILTEGWDLFTDAEEKLQFISRLAEGLDILWSRNIVHRDIKPDNVLIKPGGQPVIIDLGIARLLDMESLTMMLARRGPCTPVYAAPEQLRNRKADIDWRTDQFNLGILLVQLFLNGHHPFNPNVVGGGDSTVRNILEGRWDPGPLHTDSSHPVSDLAHRLLGNEPYSRFREPDQFFNSLRDCRQNLP
jgi:serine/threonine-protein kinase